VITSSRRTGVTSGSSLWSSVDTSRSPIQRSAHSTIIRRHKRWGQNSAYDYLKPEIEALKAAIERVGKAIDEEAAKGQGEDWSLMVGYVQSCREKLPGAIEEWQKD